MSSECFLLAAIRHLHNFDHKVTADDNDIKLLTLLLTMTTYGLMAIKVGIKYILGKL